VMNIASRQFIHQIQKDSSRHHLSINRLSLIGNASICLLHTFMTSWYLRFLADKAIGCLEIVMKFYSSTALKILGEVN